MVRSELCSQVQESFVTLVPANNGRKPLDAEGQQVDRRDKSGGLALQTLTVQSTHDAIECRHVGAVKELASALWHEAWESSILHT